MLVSRFSINQLILIYRLNYLPFEKDMETFLPFSNQYGENNCVLDNLYLEILLCYPQNLLLTTGTV